MILLLLAALILANAVFVAVEFALVASRPSLLKEAAEQGSKGASLALAARQNLRPQLSGAQLGITVSSVVLGIVAQPALGRWIDPALEKLSVPSGVSQSASWFLAMGVAAVVQMLLGEVVPKNLAIAAPERTLQRLMPLHRLFVRLLWPAIWLLDALAALAVKPFGLEAVDEIEHALGAAELSTIFAASQQKGTLDPFDHQLLSGALALAQRPASAVMVPVTSMVTLPQQATIAECEQLILATGHTRFPVSGLKNQDFVGMVHAKELLSFSSQEQDLPLPSSALRPLVVAGQNLTLEEVLRTMRQKRTHLLVLQNADGQTQGLITMEDVVQELLADPTNR